MGGMSNKTNMLCDFFGENIVNLFFFSV